MPDNQANKNLKWLLKYEAIGLRNVEVSMMLCSETLKDATYFKVNTEDTQIIRLTIN